MTWTPRRALAVLIVVSTACRLLWAAALEPGNDEAYHHLFTVHPALSYFDHPPMMMWIERVGLFLCDGIVTPLTIRLAFILLFAGSTCVLYGWAARWYGEWAGFYAALAFNITGYFTAAAGAFVLPDGPLLFFTLLTLRALSEALVARPNRVLPWVGVGLAWAGALLSKYHAVLLPAGALLYVLTTPGARRCLRTPGPYLAVAIGVTGFLPVLIWNAQHDWASFAFQSDRAVGVEFHAKGLLRTIVGQFLYLFPWMWVYLVLVLVVLWRGHRGRPGIEWLAVCLAVVPLSFFLLVSCVKDDTLPHWSLIGFVPLYPALGARWARGMNAGNRWLRRRLWIGVAVPILLGPPMAAQARFGWLRIEKDPTWEMSGWPSVTQELEAHGLVGQPNTFFFTSYWHTSGQLQFALGNRATVLCYNMGEPHGFAYWSEPADWVGHNGILVSLDDRPEVPAIYEEFFRRIELVTEFSMTRQGNPIRTVRVYRCVEQTKPFPFRPVRRRP